MASTGAMNSTESAIEIGEAGTDSCIKTEVEVKHESVECVVCASRGSDGGEAAAARTASGTRLVDFLRRVVRCELGAAATARRVCSPCLHLVDVLEQAELEYLKLKEAFEAVISKNPLFDHGRLESHPVKVEMELENGFEDVCTNRSDSEDEPLAVTKKKRNQKPVKRKFKVYPNKRKQRIKNRIDKKKNSIKRFIDETLPDEDEYFGNREVKKEDSADGSETSHFNNGLDGLFKIEVGADDLDDEDYESESGDGSEEALEGVRATRASRGARGRGAGGRGRRGRGGRGRAPAVAEPKWQRRVVHQCNQCNAKYTSLKRLESHLSKHSAGMPPYICEVCGARYKHKRACDIHVALHKGISDWKCEECDKLFPSKSALQRHNNIHTGKLNYQCDLCGKSFIHTSSFKMHKLSHSGVKPHACDVCGLALMTRSHLKRHKRVHSGEKRHECGVCGKRFSERWVGGDGGTERGPTDDVCGLALMTRSHLKRHKRVHSGEKRHECGVCGKRFSERWVGGDGGTERGPTDDVCGLALMTRSHLKRHKRVHSGEKRHECGVCGKRFSERWVGGDGGTERGPTDDVCGLALMTRSHLKRHKRVHSGEKRHECGVCGKRFSERWVGGDGGTERGPTDDVCGLALMTRSHLKRHKRVHSGEKRHECGVCGKRFSERWVGGDGGTERGPTDDVCGLALMTRSHLKRHKRVHSGEKRHECGVCGKRFSERWVGGDGGTERGPTDDVCGLALMTRSHLKRHKRVHSGEKRHECGVCGKRFSERWVGGDGGTERGPTDDVCGLALMTRSHLKRHKRVHSGEKRHECGVCGKRFSERWVGGDGGTERGPTDDVCGLALMTRSHLKRHKRVHSGEKRHECGVCGKRFSERWVGGDGGTERGPTDDVCGLALMTRSHLKRHKRVHSGEKRHECGVCGKRFSERWVGGDGGTERGPTDDVCGLALMTRSHLKRHKRVHSGEKRHECGVCGKRFSERWVGGDGGTERGPTDDVCGLALMTRSHLKRHKRVHSGEKRHECGVCGKRFSERWVGGDGGTERGPTDDVCGLALMTRSHLKRHKRVHSGEKRQECGVCGKRFSERWVGGDGGTERGPTDDVCGLALMTRSHLKRHKRVHSGEKRHECGVCGKRFSERWVGGDGGTERGPTDDVCGLALMTRSHLKRHKRVHSGEKRHECGVCGKRFSERWVGGDGGTERGPTDDVCGLALMTRSHLKRHKRVHSGEKRHECGVCGKRFSERWVGGDGGTERGPTDDVCGLALMTRSHLKRHKRVHSGEKRHECGVCGKRFSERWVGGDGGTERGPTDDVCGLALMTRSHLKRHKRVHSGEKRHECGVCGKRFSERWVGGDGGTERGPTDDVCGLALMTRSHLKRHKRVHSGEKRHECGVCGKRFSERWVGGDGGTERGPTDDVCGLALMTRSHLKRHKRVHSGEKRHECGVCGKRFSERWVGGDGGTERGPTDDVCGLALMTRSHLKRHKRVHSGEKRHECGVCGKRFSERWVGGDGGTERGPTDDVCGLALMTRSHLKRHKRVHSGEKRHECGVCGKRFSERWVGGDGGTERGPTDDVCGLALMTRSHLKRHKRVHSGEKRHECGVCGKRFSERWVGGDGGTERGPTDDVCGLALMTRSHLKRHKRVHSGEKRHECGVCGKRFSERWVGGDGGTERGPTDDVCGLALMTRSHLKRHKRVHSGEKRHECGVCGKRFSERWVGGDGGTERGPTDDVCGLALMTRSHLKRHKRVHSGEKRHECGVCGKRFSERYNLAAHAKSHEVAGGAPPADAPRRRLFRCPYCQDRFERRYMLERHVSSTHGRTLERAPATPRNTMSKLLKQQAAGRVGVSAGAGAGAGAGAEGELAAGSAPHTPQTPADVSPSKRDRSPAAAGRPLAPAALALHKLQLSSAATSVSTGAWSAAYGAEFGLRPDYH